MIAILLLASGAALCVSLVLFFILRPAEDPSRPSGRSNPKRPGRKPAKKQARNDGRDSHGGAEPADTTRLVGPGSDPQGDRRRLSAAERQEMLEGVKNLAEANPEKVAGLIRNWMSEDEDPPRS
ncbi:MAG: hypothetical protein RIF32_07720 [Leptospirales bacterium]